MTGTFELFTDDNQYFRFRLTAPDGTVIALSRPFPDKAAAVAGITAVREYAGIGLITDLCPDIPSTNHRPTPGQQPGPPLHTPRQPVQRARLRPRPPSPGRPQGRHTAHEAAIPSGAMLLELGPGQLPRRMDRIGCLAR